MKNSNIRKFILVAFFLVGLIQLSSASNTFMPTVTIDGPNIVCEGEDVVLVATGSTTGNYFWTGPNLSSTTDQTVVANGLVSGVYTYSVTFTDTNGDSATAIHTVDVLPLPSVHISYTPDVCFGDWAMLTAVSQEAVAYQWSGPNISSSPTQQTIYVDAFIIGTMDYYVTVTDANGCTAEALAILNVLPAPIVTVNPSSGTYCEGSDVCFTAVADDPNAVFDWAGPNLDSYTGGTVCASNLSVGTHSFVVYGTNMYGCQSYQESIIIEITENPSISVDPVPPVCEGSDFVLQANGPAGATYQWTGPGGMNESSPTAVVNGMAAGVYDYEVFVTVNGCISIEVVTVVIEPAPVVTISGPSILCEGEIACLTAVSTSDPGAVYNWNSTELTDNTSQNPCTYPLFPGTYVFDVTVTDANGCMGVASYTLIVEEAPPISVSSNSPINEGEDLVLEAFSSPGATIDWQGPNLTNFSGSPIVVTGLTAGIYTYTATAVDFNGCLSQASIVVEVLPPADIYVDHTATGTNDGSSWANAFTDLQDALAIGMNKTIHIAKGNYYPTSGTLRGIAFEILQGSTLLGGYPNGGGAREPLTHITNLTGEIDGVSGYAGNSYHVVKLQNVSNVVLDGLTIKWGSADNASSYGRSRGGGIYATGSAASFVNVRVRWNKGIYGGGIFATLSNITFQNSDFKNNNAEFGSAIYHSNATDFILDRTRVTNNNSTNRCAIEANNSSYTKIENSVIANNASTNANAIIIVATNRDQNIDVYNSTILGETKDKNLIVFQVGYGDQINANCYNSIIAHQDASFTRAVKAFNNNILNFNTYNCYIQGSSIIGNPSNNLYEDVAGALFLDSDYSLDACSPGIDAGNNAYANALPSDIDGNNRFFGTVDIGAYEAQTSCKNLAKESAGEQEITLSIYPNPTQGKLFVNTSIEKPEIIIVDMIGRQVLTTREIEIDINHLPKGMYLVFVLDNGKEIGVQKIIKK